MALSTVKLSELPFHKPILPFCSRFRCRLRPLTSSSSASASSASIADQNPNPNPNTNTRSTASRSAPWLRRWDPPSTPSQPPPQEKPKPPGSIERIVHRLRNLGLEIEDELQKEEELDRSEPLSGDQRLGELLARSWVRPDLPAAADPVLLPWERRGEAEIEEEEETGKRRRVKAPTLAELTIEDEELSRLRRMGMTLREKINIPKAGITQVILEKIHDYWRRSELVRLKFHEDLAHDMKTAHEIVEVREFLVNWMHYELQL